jgi:uncharacterized protein (DUF983 family)
MIRKGNRLYSILYFKCPRCHEGDLFIGKTYSRNVMSMPERCSKCNLIYEKEPAFFTGAMYVSYALQVALLTTVYVALRVLINPPFEFFILIVPAAAAILFPVTLRLSRAIYINFFHSYDKRDVDTPLKQTPRSASHA